MIKSQNSEDHTGQDDPSDYPFPSDIDPDFGKAQDEAKKSEKKAQIPFYKANYIPPVNIDHSLEHVLETPKMLYDYLDRCVYGHSEYKRTLAIFFWKCFHHIRPGTILIAGRSGTGKTEAIRALNRVYRNIVIGDGSNVTPQGYKGGNKIFSLMTKLDYTDAVYMPVFVLDEADKLIQRANNDWSGTGLLFELLKMLEGGLINVGTEEKPNMIDTSNVAFILLGAFSAITDAGNGCHIGFNSDLIVAKNLDKKSIFDMIPPELQGRIEETVILEPLTEDDYKNIIRSTDYSPITRLSDALNINLRVSEKRMDSIAHDAYTAGTGVRSMNNDISRYINQRLFDDPDIKNIYYR